LTYLNPNIELVKCSETLYNVKNIFTETALTYWESHYYYPHTWQFDQTSGMRMVKNIDPTDQILNEFNQELKQFLLEKFNAKYEAQIAKLFFDTRGYRTGVHADDPSIALMIQIYLQSECIDAPGTSFHLEKIYNMQLIRNHGYFNFNTDAKQHESYTLPNGARRSFAMSMSLIN
jgi:hypothetical protein